MSIEKSVLEKLLKLPADKQNEVLDSSRVWKRKRAQRVAVEV
jgi:hypothetical protein